MSYLHKRIHMIIFFCLRQNLSFTIKEALLNNTYITWLLIWFLQGTYYTILKLEILDNRESAA